MYTQCTTNKTSSTIKNYQCTNEKWKHGVDDNREAWSLSIYVYMHTHMSGDNETD